MRIRLLTRLGQNKPGSLIDTTDTEADWLITNGKAEAVDDDSQQQDTSRTAGSEQQDEPLDPDAVNKDDLKAQAEALGLPTSGTKAQLADRIQQHQERQQAADD
jgi:hypothetical protein